MFSRRRALMLTGLAPLAAAAPPVASAAQAAQRITQSEPETLTTPPECRVQTSAGAIQGFRRGPVYTFKGVPYGASTAGAARFAPPKPVQPWTGVRKTLTFGPTSWQPVRNRNNPDLAFVNDWDDGYPGDECLVVNVWTTAMAASAKRPVMVWLHGGGFTTGSSQEFPSYDGGALAKRGVVLVSVNHRLGPHGFLDLSGLGGDPASGNVGMMDIVLALQWVRDNIARFGGDPSRVTVFGQSGGGGKVSTLMAMPSAKGLFHRAIVMSGSMPSTRPPADSRALAEATMAELGARDLPGLQAADPMRLVEAGLTAIRKLGERKITANWGPVFDGAVVAEDWRTSAPALSAEVPMMIGSTRDEFRRWGVVPAEADLPGFVPAALSAKAPQIIGALHAAYPQARPIDIGGYITGMSWRNSALEQARKKAALGAAPVYSYWFTYVGTPFDGALGVPHCADIPYAFDNVAVNDQLTGNTAEAHAVADRIATAFVNFAATGDPGQPGLAWPRFEAARVQTMVFDRQSRATDDPAGEARRLLMA